MRPAVSRDYISNTWHSGRLFVFLPISTRAFLERFSPSNLSHHFAFLSTPVKMVAAWKAAGLTYVPKSVLHFPDWVLFRRVIWLTGKPGNQKIVTTNTSPLLRARFADPSRTRSASMLSDAVNRTWSLPSGRLVNSLCCYGGWWSRAVVDDDEELMRYMQNGKQGEVKQVADVNAEAQAHAEK